MVYGGRVWYSTIVPITLIKIFGGRCTTKAIVQCILSHCNRRYTRCENLQQVLVSCD